MLQCTVITRLRDGLALAADTESSAAPHLEAQRAVAKNLVKNFVAEASRNSQAALPSMQVVDGQDAAFFVLLRDGVVFMTMCDRCTASTATPVAFAFLDDVSREFLQQYGPQISTVTRPFSFIKFDLFLQKTKKVFCTTAPSRGGGSAASTKPLRRTVAEVLGTGSSAADLSRFRAGYPAAGSPFVGSPLMDHSPRGYPGTLAAGFNVDAEIWHVLTHWRAWRRGHRLSWQAQLGLGLVAFGTVALLLLILFAFRIVASE